MGKNLDPRTYVLLERAFVRRLQKSWAKQSAPTYAAIAKACIEHKWDEARRLVSDLDMTEIGIENREWIQYMLLSCAVFGASSVARSKPSFVGVGTFDTLLKQVTNTFLQYLEYGGTTQVQAAALQSIAEDEAKTKAQLAQKKEHKYGNTQIHIDPHSSAYASIEAARDAIKDADVMADGKDVKPNHVTVRYGLVNEDLDELRTFIAGQAPFEAHMIGVELFPASEYSDGAVPVVGRVASPELRLIEHEIGKYAAFKEKSFPVYKPHVTLAYVKPDVAPSYADLYVDGVFLVRGITISHQSGVQETIPFGLTQKRWEEGKHPRDPGGDHGGEFVARAGMHLAGPRDADRLKALGVAQGGEKSWVQVQIADSPNAYLQAVGLDVKGRTQYKYSKAHNAKAADSKFARMKEFTKTLPSIRATIAKDMESTDPVVKEAASVLFLIDKTAIRIGSEADTKAEVKAYGATTLLDRHVTVRQNTSRFQFTAKKGVEMDKTVVEGKLAKMITARKRKVAADEQLFKTTDSSVRRYMNKRWPGFSPKDFRTYHGTAIALREIKKLPVTKNETEFKQAQKDVAMLVAAHLGNTWNVSLKEYIDPAVWGRLRKK
jgi:DNA topoisomerase-1